MWGAITGVLHVIPYAGAAVATVGIGVAMFLHSGSVASTALAMGVVMVIATLIGIGLPEWLQGRASRMNAVAVFVAVLFFGWLWGGWGLLLGMPILAVREEHQRSRRIDAAGQRASWRMNATCASRIAAALWASSYACRKKSADAR